METFSSFSGARIARLYFVPGVALRGDGSIQCLQSRAGLERFFQAAVDGNLVRVEKGWQILASTYHVG